MFYSTKYLLFFFLFVKGLNAEGKALLRDCLLEPEPYGDSVYKFKKLIGRNNISFQFRKNSIRYKRIEYNLNVVQPACLDCNPIMVDN